MPVRRRSEAPSGDSTGWTPRSAFATLRLVRRPLVAVLVTWIVVMLVGCGSAPQPNGAPAPPTAPAERSASTAVSHAADTVGSIPGSADAKFVYRFRQTDPAASGTFSYRDRDLSFSFRPSPNVLYFGVENLQGRPVQIDWDRSVFLNPDGQTAKVAHSSTRWRDRFSTQAFTQVLPQQRYTDYVFSIDDLLDPGASPDTQLRRPLLPEDSSAPAYADKSFGVDLLFLVEGQPRTYTFRFQVVSVIPR